MHGNQAQGDTRPSLAASMVEKQIKYQLSDKEMAWLIATMYVHTSSVIARFNHLPTLLSRLVVLLRSRLYISVSLLWHVERC